MNLIVTGTGRCGTRYVAYVLTQAGIRCGHETVFGPYGPNGGSLPDVSWLAVPHLADYPTAHRTLIWREPNDVIASLQTIGLFDRPSIWRDYQTGILGEQGSPFERACHHYVEWNRMALEHVDAVTSIHNIDWVALLGPGYTPDLGVRIAEVVARTPSNVNGSPRTTPHQPLPQAVRDMRDVLCYRSR